MPIRKRKTPCPIMVAGRIIHDRDSGAWHGLGASVTLLAQDDGLLPRMEPFAGEMIARAFTDTGIDVRVGVTVTGVRRPARTGPVPHRRAATRGLMRVYLFLMVVMANPGAAGHA